MLLLTRLVYPIVAGSGVNSRRGLWRSEVCQVRDKVV